MTSEQIHTVRSYEQNFHQIQGALVFLGRSILFGSFFIGISIIIAAVI